MKFRKLIAVSTAALAIGLATPALAQNNNDNQNDNNNQNSTNTTNNTTNNGTSTGVGVASASSNGIGGNANQDNDQDNDTVVTDVDTTVITDASQDNDGNVGGNNTEVETGDNNLGGFQANDNEFDDHSDDDGFDLDVGDVLSNNGNGDNRDNEDNDESYGDGSASRGGEVEADAEDGSAASVNGDATNVEVEDVNLANDKSNAASKGGEIDTVASGDGSIAASRGGEVEIGNTEDSGNVEDSNNQNGSIIAEQELVAIISNDGGMEAVLAKTEGYESGKNEVRGSAFAAFAGILNQAWNTGANANTQAATNIAAQGTVNFEVNNNPAPDGEF